MTFRTIATKSAPGAIGTYSQAVAAGGVIYVSGQIPLDPETMLVVAGGIKEQARRVFNNIQAIVTAGSSSLDQVVKLTVYLVDLENFSAINTIMTEYFSCPYPARAVIEVSALPKGVAIEIDAIATTTSQ